MSCPKADSSQWVYDVLENYANEIANDFQSSTPPFMATFAGSDNRKDRKIDFLGKSMVFYQLLHKFASKLIFSRENGGRVFGVLAQMLRSISDKMLPRGPIFFKASRYQWKDRRSDFDRFKYLTYRFLIFFRLLYKRTIYSNACREVLQDEKFIYFPAPLEPEGSTIPTALFNRHVPIALTQIAQSLPEGWKILFKASPFQFSRRIPFSTIPDWHSPDFYQRLNESGKIVFASQKTPTHHLIDRSVGVACINGTVAVEAVHRGKQCITFSPNWYDQLDGIHRCQSPDDVKRAIQLMIDGVIPNPDVSKLHFAESAVFDSPVFIDCNFTEDVQSVIARKMVASLRLFEGLDERKWKV